MNSDSPREEQLDGCGCCEGLNALTPAEIANRPGLSAIAYRVGTYAQFKETMLARLSAVEGTRRLKARDRDFGIALLDAWAVVADVLTFYQERIANESYLRTATERRSVVELARAIGYKLRPGVAASTYLAFRLDEAPDSPALQTTIEAGVKVQSIPGPDEFPQVFETIEEIEARAEWNAIRPLLVQRQTIWTTMQSILFEGTATNLKPGDRLLITLPPGREVRRVTQVDVDAKSKTTRVHLEGAPSVMPDPPEGSPPAGEIFTDRRALDRNVLASLMNYSWRAEDLRALARIQGWSLEALQSGLNALRSSQLTPTAGEVFAFRLRAAIFGHNAPRFLTPPPDQVSNDNIEDATLASVRHDTRQIHLDNAYPAVVKNSWLILERPAATPVVYLVETVDERTLSAFALTAKVSAVTLRSIVPPNDEREFPSFKLRETTVFAQNERLALADLPLNSPLERQNIILDGAYLSLKTGQRVVVAGERVDLPGTITSEIATLSSVTLAGGLTTIAFERQLEHSYKRATVTINANVARATHGESITEVLGSGDASQSFQSFGLSQPPLTYVSSADGAQSTLEVYVDDVLWHEVETFFDRAPGERIYVTRQDDSGQTTLQFGDGKSGARLPTGQENIKAKYRKGIGLEGLVRAGQLSLPMTRPLGVRTVANPLAAGGADARESLANARSQAPLPVLTLGRVVSLRDYEDFARTFPGIGKALATWTWSGSRRAVLVTIAGVNGAEVSAISDTYRNLLAALQKYGDPLVSLRLLTYRPRLFRLSVKVKLEEDYQPEPVITRVKANLRSHFSFAERAFGQAVARSEVVALIQRTNGVAAVDLDAFYLAGETPASAPPSRLIAAMPQAGARGAVNAAELLMLDPGPLDVRVFS